MSVSTPSTSSGKWNGAMLVLTKQPPVYAFAEEWFEIEVALDTLPVQVANNAPTSTLDVKLVATLHDIQSDSPFHDKTALLTDPFPIEFSNATHSPSCKRHTKVVRCKIGNIDSWNKKRIKKQQPTELAIRITAFDKFHPSRKNHHCDISSLENSNQISSVLTTVIQIAKHKLDIIKSRNNEWDRVWYKNEGGREKCISVTVGLYSKCHTLKIGEPIPLKVVLFYDTKDGPILVANQTILRLLGPSAKNLKINDNTGTATVRFRIDDISRNHQGNDFIVQISVDNTLHSRNDVIPIYTPAVCIKSKRIKRRCPEVMHDDSSDADKSLMQADDATLQPSPISSPFLTAAVPLDASQVQKALKGVMAWTEEVINCLRPMQWKIIHYEKKADGSDAHPCYTMKNPNEHITRILSKFSESTSDDIRTLSSIVNTDHWGNTSTTSTLETTGLTKPTQDPHGAAGTGLRARAVCHDAENQTRFVPPYHPRGGTIAPARNKTSERRLGMVEVVDTTPNTSSANQYCKTTGAATFHTRSGDMTAFTNYNAHLPGATSTSTSTTFPRNVKRSHMDHQTNPQQQYGSHFSSFRPPLSSHPYQHRPPAEIHPSHPRLPTQRYQQNSGMPPASVSTEQRFRQHYTGAQQDSYQGYHYQQTYDDANESVEAGLQSVLATHNSSSRSPGSNGSHGHAR